MRKITLTMSLLLFFGFSLYAQPRAVGEPRVLVQSFEPLQMPVWSADGSTLFLNNGTMEVSKNGTNLRQASAPVSNLTRRTADSNQLVRRMVDAPMQVASQVVGLNSLAGELIFNPVMSPTGDRVVFQAGNKGMFVVNADGTGLRSLGTQYGRATWTPDGQYVVVMVEGNDGYFITRGELFSINVNTGAVSPLLTSDRYIAFSPAISPDGRTLAFEEVRTGAIFIMDIE